MFVSTIALQFLLTLYSLGKIIFQWKFKMDTDMHKRFYSLKNFLLG